MASKTGTAKVADIPTTTEAVYTVDELASNSFKVFGKRIGPDIVNAAFMISDKKKATISEAKKIVEDFISGEVK